jgi:N-acetylglucosamine kinase-like BadF-type ATPase
MDGPGSTLVVDAGQTATRAALAGATRQGHGPGVEHLRVDGAAGVAARAILAAAEGVRARAVETVCIGLSGFVSAPPVLDRIGGEVAAGLDAARVVIASDAVTAYLGALGPRPGVVVAAGTGTVALAADGRGATALVDGWGHLLGDAGSGFAIGRAGLASALAEHDGRGGSEALRARAEAAFGPLAELPAVVYGAEAPAGRIASFAEHVAEAAREGDPIAREIWAAAAADLAGAAIAAARRVFGPLSAASSDVHVSWNGGLFSAGPLLLEPFQRAMTERAPDLRLTPPAGSSLDGARLLADPATADMFPGLIWTGP